jgi:hypothetical protein
MSANIVSVLNDLIETSNDGQKGFRKAAEDTKDASLKLLFADRAEDCARGASELQALVQRLGGKPETGGTVGGIAAGSTSSRPLRPATTTQSSRSANVEKTLPRKIIAMLWIRNCPPTCA